MDARPIFLSISDPSDFRDLGNSDPFLLLLLLLLFFPFRKRATYHRKRSLLKFSLQEDGCFALIKGWRIKTNERRNNKKVAPLSLPLVFFRVTRWCIRRFAFVAEVL